MFKGTIKIWLGFTLSMILVSILMIVISVSAHLSDGLTFAFLILMWGLVGFFWGKRFWDEAGPWKKMNRFDQRIFLRFITLGVICCGFFIYALLDLHLL